MTATQNEAKGPVSTEAGPSRMCSKCGENPRRDKHSWCKPCINEAAKDYQRRTRTPETFEDRPCERRGCLNTFAWRSTHPKQRYCSKDCYTQGVLDERQDKRDQAKLDAFLVGKRRCGGCGVVKPDEEFGAARGTCKSCGNDANARWRERNPERAAEVGRQSAQRRRLKKYDLTPERYAQMLIDQSGLCAICDAQLRLDHIDHDHNDRHVRGLLCNSCNTRLHDGPIEWYVAAAEYLALSVTEI